MTAAQADTSAAEQETPQLVPRKIERLALTINPKYLQSLKQAEVLGYERPADKRILDARFYEIATDSLRQRIDYVLTYYLRWKFHELEKFPATSIETQIGTIVPLCVNACMMALYSKLRTIHEQYGTYASRYTVTSGYSKDLELPLPFADAIQNFGVFETNNMITNYIFVPVFPENVKYEGRSTEEWQAFKYKSCIPILKECGIPMKNVDTRIKLGSPWWTYKVANVCNTFDFQRILPPSHYSDHSAILAAMFLFSDPNGTPIQLIKHRDDEPNYGVRFREVMNGFQLRAFSALCHAKPEEWNQRANV